MPRTRCILITGFGPFPGAPFNPTTSLVRHLARLRRPALADVRLVGHVFRTSYAAVDRELPALLNEHRPDAVLMFGLASRSAAIRIEMQARNALMARPDAGAVVPRSRQIDAGGPQVRPGRAPISRLLQAARACAIPADLSRDAGRYVCNYTYWRALESSGAGRPRLVVFVHVPPLRRAMRPAGKRRRGGPDSAALLASATAILMALAAALRRPVPRPGR